MVMSLYPISFPKMPAVFIETALDGSDMRVEVMAQHILLKLYRTCFFPSTEYWTYQKYQILIGTLGSFIPSTITDVEEGMRGLACSMRMEKHTHWEVEAGDDIYWAYISSRVQMI